MSGARVEMPMMQTVQLSIADAVYATAVREALARTGAVNMLVAGSAAYLINSRYLLNSTVTWKGVFGSRPVWLAIGLVLLLQLDLEGPPLGTGLGRQGRAPPAAETPAQTPPADTAGFHSC